VSAFDAIASFRWRINLKCIADEYKN